ncbi:hypothetical protein NYE24_00535 [Paenibacillus sp. FSL H7-0350]|uniref:hypothetical protein n=1 Tax=Paenibacillus sp. FSL H7-0350 TaxID=2975345 RepID=UPI0031583D6A
MSLSIAKCIPGTLIVAADGRGVNGNGVAMSNNVDKLFVIDGRVIFISGSQYYNMQIINKLKRENTSNLSLIQEICKTTMNSFLNDTHAKAWLKDTLPICLTVFEYIPNHGFYFTVFTPENDFSANSQPLKPGSTLCQGIEKEEAMEVFKKKGSVSSLEALYQKILDTYSDMESRYTAIGGEISFVVIDNKGIRNFRFNHTNKIHSRSSDLRLISKTGDIVLNEDGIVQTDTIQLADNVDSTHGLKLKFYLDDGLISVKAVKLNFTLEKFRAYSKGALSETIALDSTNNSETIGRTTESAAIDLHSTLPENVTGLSQTDGFYTSTGGHNHGIPAGTVFKDINGVPRTWVPSGGHQHQVILDAHSHGITVPSHAHDFTIPPHTHSISMPPHAHGIDYGIYESTFASGVRVVVDGVIRGSIYNASENNVDITEWIQTTGWHTVELTSTQLGRVNSSLYVKSFVSF